MEKKYMSITDEVYTFTESDQEDVFYFYRNDDGVIGENYDPKMIMDFYRVYIFEKMTKSENVPEMVCKDLEFTISDDGKAIRLIAKDTGKAKKEPNVIKRFFKKFSTLFMASIIATTLIGCSSTKVVEETQVTTVETVNYDDKIAGIKDSSIFSNVNYRFTKSKNGTYFLFETSNKQGYLDFLAELDREHYLVIDISNNQKSSFIYDITYCKK